MKIKGILLFAIIGLPVCVYLFLQAFGENHFSIPVYYENGLEVPFSDCGQLPMDEQYFSEKLSANYSESDVITVYDLGTLQSGNPSVRNNLMSFLNKFRKVNDVQLISMASDSVDVGSLSGYAQAVFYRADAKGILNYGRCILQSDLRFDTVENKFVGSQLVLVDKDRKIRGYYDPAELEEIDRLNTELHILLSN